LARPIQSELFRSWDFSVSRHFGQTIKSYMLTSYCKRTWINKKFYFQKMQTCDTRSNS